MMQRSKGEVKRKAKKEQLLSPSDESIKESKEIVNQLREKIEKEGSDKIIKDVLLCNVGH